MEQTQLNTFIRKLLNFSPNQRLNITIDELSILCNTIQPIFEKQPMLLELEAPINICGDIHGQYYDLIRLFKLGGVPPKSNYLFLGDYVDRGNNSIETICLLFTFKLKFPNHFFLLRGNHEAEDINKEYGFLEECIERYGKKNGNHIWKMFNNVFSYMPVSALVEDRILCMHGGISPQLNNIYDINNIKRPTNIPDNGILCDLVWSDPDNTLGWGENDRGVSFIYGRDVTEQFIKKHDIDLVCRAHQVVEDGYLFHFNRKVVTIFSAPNYCGEFDNNGAIMTVDKDLFCSFLILEPIDKEMKKLKSVKHKVDTPPPEYNNNL